MKIAVKQVQSVGHFYAWDQQKPNSKIWLFPMAPSNAQYTITGMPAVTKAASGLTLNLPDFYLQGLYYGLATSLYTALPRDNGVDPEVIWKAGKGALDGIKSYNNRMRTPVLRSGFKSRRGNNGGATFPYPVLGNPQ